jgi:hypothetical protein
MGEFHKNGPDSLGDEHEPFADCPLVYLEWQDSSGTEEWRSLEEIHNRKIELDPCKSVGWVLRETADWVELAQNIGTGHGGEHPQACHVMTIPRAAIIKRVNFDASTF